MSNPFYGEIKIFGCNYAPRNWSKCQGQILAISQHQALFSLLGANYGGDARSTFGLPDLQGRAIIGADSRSAPLASMGGAETVSLSVVEIPTHTHSVNIPASEDLFGSGPEVNMGYLQKTAANNVFSTSPGANSMAGVSLSNNSGSSQPHENRQPYLVLNYCIAISGLYPHRN